MTTEPAFDADLALAHRLADAAAIVALTHFQREFRRWSKSDGSLVTEADVAVEDSIRQLLAVNRPEDAILGEERGQTGSSDRRWIIDAIDGTISFAAGEPEWGTLIALEVGGRIAVSVCDEAARKLRYWAIAGGGAFCRSPQHSDRRLEVSSVRDLAAARSYIPPLQVLQDERARRVAEVLSQATRPQLPEDHPALEVASGRCDLAVIFRAGPWDVAGPAVVVEEAGGRFSNLAGDYDFMTGTAVFSNGHVHDAALRLASAI
jgi:histidinol-phosphatase